MKKQSLVRGIYLSWIVVADIKKAIEFYEEKVGLTLVEQAPEFGWAEFAGPEGSRLGIAQANAHMPVGQNAVVTITVDDIEAVRDEYKKMGVTLIGDVMEVPGHVKLQTFADADNNQFQLCQKLD